MMGHFTYPDHGIAFSGTAGGLKLKRRPLGGALDDRAQITRKPGRVPVVGVFGVVLVW